MKHTSFTLLVAFLIGIAPLTSSALIYDPVTNSYITEEGTVIDTDSTEQSNNASTQEDDTDTASTAPVVTQQQAQPASAFTRERDWSLEYIHDQLDEYWNQIVCTLETR